MSSNGGTPTPIGGPLPIVVLISGSGSTLANLVARLADGRLRGLEIRHVISSNASAGGVTLAREAGLGVSIIRPRDFPGIQTFSEALAARIAEQGGRLVVMGGFLCLWKIPRELRNRVLNIHPALLPRFGGRGMYGRRVHEAVLSAGERESGCTVHLADDEYDHGPILAMARVPVLAGDTPTTLAARVGEAERELYPRVLQRIADDGVGLLDQIAGGAPLEL